MIANLPATITAAEKQAALDAKAAYDVLCAFNDKGTELKDAFTAQQKAALAGAVSQAEALDAADEKAIQTFVDAVKVIKPQLKDITDEKKYNIVYIN